MTAVSAPPDADREHVVEILREAFSAGRLTLEEFDERTTLAFAAKTWGGSRDLTRDLPRQASLELPRPEPQVGPRGTSRCQCRPGRRAARLSPMLPILVIWLGIALSFRDPYAFIPVLVILFTLLRLATRRAGSTGQGRTRRPGTTTQGRATGPDGTPAQGDAIRFSWGGSWLAALRSSRNSVRCWPPRLGGRDLHGSGIG